MNFSILDMVQHGLLCSERCGLYQQHYIHAGTAAMAYPPTLKERILNPIEGGYIKVIHVKICNSFSIHDHHLLYIFLLITSLFYRSGTQHVQAECEIKKKNQS